MSSKRIQQRFEAFCEKHDLDQEALDDSIKKAAYSFAIFITNQKKQNEQI